LKTNFRIPERQLGYNIKNGIDEAIVLNRGPLTRQVEDPTIRPDYYILGLCHRESFRKLDALSNMGLLSRFVGMLTDSRSFLSYPRHEYFRRVLCNLLGRDIQNGELPDDFDLIGGMVGDICYRNAVEYFGIAMDPQ